MACRKNDHPVRPEVFNTVAAKEWYYGSFKQSAEFQAANTAIAGKKFPDWKTGRYKKLGNMEIVEFDLVEQKKGVLVKPSGNRFNDNRIAEATLTRAVFIKTGRNIKLELIKYIPELNYLTSRNYDISKNGLLNPDEQFTGKVLITRWNGDLVKGYNVEHGKKKNVITKLLKQAAPADDAGTPNTPINPDCYYSYYAWAEQNCTTYTNGDDVSIEFCSDWELVWDNLQETSCPLTQGDCETLGLSTEDCMCQMMGVGCDGEDTNQDDAIISEYNNANNAVWSYVTNLDYTCITTSAPYTSHYNNWLLAKHGFGWWDASANSRWTYATSNGSINLSEFIPVSTALNTHTTMLFNTIEWTQKEMTNNSINFNNTPNPKGKQIVTGSIRIKSKLPTAVMGLLDTGQQSAEGTLNVNFHL